jgi:hypothetical protein
MKDKQSKAQVIKDELLRWAGFKIAPGCTEGCHMITPEGNVISTKMALAIAARNLFDTVEPPLLS